MKSTIITTISALVLMGTAPLPAQDFNLNGFVEGAYGSRIQSNNMLDDRAYTLGESRLQIQLSHAGESAEFYSAVDFLADNVAGRQVNSNIREAYLQFGLGSRADMKIGRQILTWGTGDLLFINDLFPKNYISFFVGREDQYLKLPSDALKMRVFTSAFDMDLIGIPYFEPDRLPDGQRLSSFNPLAGQTVGQTDLPAPFLPSSRFSNAELAARIYRYVGSFQASGYLFRGFYKGPMGIDPVLGGMYYPELTAYGASFRGPLWSGVFSTEYGYYDSREDRNGVNPMIPNSQHRYLVGFERQWWTDFTLGLQYYGEYMQNHARYEETLPLGAPKFDKLRQVATMRFTQLLRYQTINLSFFTFYSPTDEDWHIRPNISYKYSDNVSISVGGNFFGGNKMFTLFGQFENNNNLYARFRYYF